MTDNKKVSILLAVYNPNISWLEELLHSLEKQTYRDIEVIARDDCSPNIDIDAIKAVFEKCLVKTQWSLKKNDKNIGSNRTFELLTAEAEGAYFAYCDQDDIWHAQKIRRLVQLIEETKSVLVCSDMKIIDGDGNVTASSITDIRKRHVFRRGTSLTEGLLQTNFVTGCAMLIRKETAKRALPFVKETYHDHWLALYASTKGGIDYTKVPLIQYRIHGENQSGVLVGIKTKKDYYEKRLDAAEKRDRELLCRFQGNKKVNSLIRQRLAWIVARKKYQQHAGLKSLNKMVKGKRFGKHIVLLESVLPFMPECVFRLVIKLTVKGVL